MPVDDEIDGPGRVVHHALAEVDERRGVGGALVDGYRSAPVADTAGITFTEYWAAVFVTTGVCSAGDQMVPA
jgi:hypothetical protein